MTSVVASQTEVGPFITKNRCIPVKKKRLGWYAVSSCESDLILLCKKNFLIPGGHWFSGIAGSNPVGGMIVLWMLCVVRYRSLRRAALSSRGALPSVVCLECGRESSI